MAKYFRNILYTMAKVEPFATVERYQITAAKIRNHVQR